MLRDKDTKRLLIIEILIVFLVIILAIIFKFSIASLVIALSFLLVTDIIVWLILYKQSKKIRNLSIYMNNILNNNYSLDIRDYEEGDISNLKNDIYKMTVKLKEQNDLSLKDKKYLEEILSDISHQLKTPLTSMYVINDVLLADNKISDEKKQEFLIKNRKELERIEWLVTSLLKMSRLDSGSETLKIKEVTLGNLIKKVLEPLEIPIELKKQELVLFNDEEEIYAYANESDIEQVLLNIISNAIKYTPEGGKIGVNVEQIGDNVEILVKDSGIGIPKEDLPRIFERFYRVDKARSREMGGTGLGLSIAKTMVEANGGKIKIDSDYGKGTEVRIRLKVSN